MPLGLLPINTFAKTAESAGGVAVLGIDGKTLIIQIATFVLVFLLLKKYAFGPIVKTLDARYEKIESSLDKAEKLEEANQKAEAEVQKLLRQARTEAEEIIAKSRDEAGAIISDASNAAEAKAKKILADSLAKIDQQAEKTQEELKKQTLELVSQATAALLGEKVDAKKNEQLIKKALSEVQQ